MRIETQCCVVGGGPAGMILGWLLARAGVDVVVLEKHADFLRDFRGDTVHPSTLELMRELGVLDEFLRMPHTEMDHLDLEILGERLPGPDFRTVSTESKFIALMPQWDFLEFVRRQASRYPGFTLIQEAKADGLVHADGRVVGVTATTPRGKLEVSAALVVGCDGRHSAIRGLAGLERRDFGAPIDVLWVRLPRRPSDGEQVLALMSTDRFLVMLNRGDYWQCAFLIEKGGLASLKQRGLPAFRHAVKSLVPFLADRVALLDDWDDIKLLTVVADRLERWWTPGLLCIGDAAHAMSPIGGVGINLAIQDAVAAAYRLAEPLRAGRLASDDLAAVQARREPPTRKVQRLQLAVQSRVLAPVVAGHGRRALRVTAFVMRHLTPLRRIAAEMLGVGQREPVAPPVATPGPAARPTASASTHPPA